MDGKSQTPQEERIKILQSLMPEVFDEDSSQLKNRYSLANERIRRYDLIEITMDNSQTIETKELMRVPKRNMLVGRADFSSSSRKPIKNLCIMGNVNFYYSNYVQQTKGGHPSRGYYKPRKQV